MPVEQRDPTGCSSLVKMGGRDDMIKASSSLQDLRRRIYAKAKAEPSWRFWGLSRCFGSIRDWVEKSSGGTCCGPGNVGASVGRGGVGSGSMKIWGSLRVTGFGDPSCGRKRSQPDRSHNPWHVASRKAQCGKSARCV